MTDSSWKKKARRHQSANGVGYTRARREVDAAHHDGQAKVDSHALLSALGIDKPESLDVKALWEPRHRPTGTTRQMLLRTPIGLTPAGEPVWLDLKDPPLGGHGPHGLIVGMTGSGKSTALETVVFGLCVLHSPEVLQVIWGCGKGSEADVFANAFANYPHVAARLTGQTAAGDIALALDYLIEQRSQALIDAGTELTGCRYRDVDAYHEARDAGAALPPMPYTVIVIDELPQDEPTVAAVCRVQRQGGALGIRVLIATHPLWSNTTEVLEHSTYRLSFASKLGESSSYLAGQGFLATPPGDAPVALRMFAPLSDSAIGSIGRQLAAAATAAR
ncbi:FtsK/SpoIIIE domain-containing protein [Mycobacteroides abscessus]|uniref:FtsK/SpoIIIE domain-containing protein n=1 Tax=Mycobacteroides abscessus TaxID=36809 RepID=UPI001F44EA69